MKKDGVCWKASVGKTIAIGEYVEGKVKAINHIEEASEEGMNDFTDIDSTIVNG